jgi:hypothetical protein
MRDAFGQARELLACEMDSHSALPIKPIVADPWVISSLLQKSIRRGETEIAQRAALALVQVKGAAIWRRLMVIVFEDIGIGSLDAVTKTVAAASDSTWRNAQGGNTRLAVTLAGILAEAPKDRSADYLVGAKDHPSLTGFAQEMASASLMTRLCRTGSRALDLPHRAVASLFASGVGRRSSDRDALLASLRDLGVPEELVIATGIAAARTGEPIAVMVPLIWLAARDTKQSVRDCIVPALVESRDVPLYALDQHTRLGREAIWRFARENKAVRACLAGFVPEKRWRSSAYIAGFYIDGAPVARRLVWDQSESLEAFGIERDLLHAGMPADGIRPLLEVMRANLGHLNEVRRQVLSRSQADVVAGEVRHD